MFFGLIFWFFSLILFQSFANNCVPTHFSTSDQRVTWHWMIHRHMKGRMFKHTAHFTIISTPLISNCLQCSCPPQNTCFYLKGLDMDTTSSLWMCPHNCWNTHMTFSWWASCVRHFLTQTIFCQPASKIPSRSWESWCDITASKSLENPLWTKEGVTVKSSMLTKLWVTGVRKHPWESSGWPETFQNPSRSHEREEKETSWGHINISLPGRHNKPCSCFHWSHDLCLILLEKYTHTEI